MDKKTLVVGATPNPERFAYKAVHALQKHGHTVVPFGIKQGSVGGKEIVRVPGPLSNIHTVTMYIGPQHQAHYYDYLLSLAPQRIIFNPGTENHEFIQMAKNKGIETVVNCTLMMLNMGSF